MELPVRDELRDVAARLREAVEAAGTQSEVAELIGVSKTTLKRYVSGRSEAPDEAVRKIAAAASFTFEWVKEGREPKQLAGAIRIARKLDPGPSDDEIRAHVRRHVASACETAGIDFDAGDPEVETFLESSLARVLVYPPEQRVFVAGTVASAQSDAILFARQQAIRRAAHRVRR